MARHLRFTHSNDKRKRPYWRDERLLGKTFVHRQQEGILIIGKDIWTRQQLVEDLKCGNFAAAVNLSKIAARLQVDSLQQLSNRFTMEDLFVEDRFGLVTMYVLMCALESQQKNPIEWIDRKTADIVTLDTEKHRAKKAQLEREKHAREERRKKVGAGRLVPPTANEQAKGA